jgi:hypothetical protein
LCRFFNAAFAATSLAAGNVTSCFKGAMIADSRQQKAAA